MLRARKRKQDLLILLERSPVCRPCYQNLGRWICLSEASPQVKGRYSRLRAGVGQTG